ncbi:MAG: aminotransferase class V-fold PLP-dependent enzyme [Fibrobacterota bacterium]
MAMSAVYLDNNASTRVDPSVLDAMLPWFTGNWGNASSKHGFGMDAAGAIQKARRQVRTMVGAEMDSEIVLTSGGTESDNMAILSALDNRLDRDEIVVTEVEHPAVLAMCDHLSRTKGVKVVRVGVDSFGRVDLRAFRTAIGPRTAVVCAMWANNETGNVHPVRVMAEMAHAEGALFFSDAVQAAGRLDIDVASTGVDFLSISSHKFHGPKGAGALYVKQGLRTHACLHGGRQERGRRAGTENVPAIVGMGRAAAIAQGRTYQDAKHQESLRNRLRDGLVARFPDCKELGDPDHRLSNTLCVAFEEIEGEDLVTLLGREGVHVSSGSACAAGSNQPSHVLRAMKVPFARIRGAVRFSLSRESIATEIDTVLEVLPAVVAKLRSAGTLRHVA